MSKAESTINDAIDEAISEIPKEDKDALLQDGDKPDENLDGEEKDGKSDDEEKSDESMRGEADDKSDDDADKDDGKLSDADLNDAISLFKGLNDPSKAPALAKFIAERAGLNLATDRPKDTEDKPDDKAELTPQKIIEDALGTKYSFLAPALIPAIVNAAKAVVIEETRGLRDSFDSRETKSLKQEITAAKENLFSNFPEAKKLGQEIGTIISSQSIPKADDQSWSNYFEDLLFVVAGRKGIVPKRNTKVVVNKNKSNRNRTDAASRLASESISDANIKEVAEGNKSIGDTIRESMKEVGL